MSIAEPLQIVEVGVLSMVEGTSLPFAMKICLADVFVTPEYENLMAVADTLDSFVLVV